MSHASELIQYWSRTSYLVLFKAYPVFTTDRPSEICLHVCLLNVYEFVIDFTLLFNHHKNIYCLRTARKVKQSEMRRRRRGKRRERGGEKTVQIDLANIIGQRCWPRSAHWCECSSKVSHGYKRFFFCFIVRLRWQLQIAALGTLTSEREREGERRVGGKESELRLLKLHDRLQSSPSPSPSLFVIRVIYFAVIILNTLVSLYYFIVFTLKYCAPFSLKTQKADEEEEQSMRRRRRKQDKAKFFFSFSAFAMIN